MMYILPLTPATTEEEDNSSTSAVFNSDASRSDDELSMGDEMSMDGRMSVDESASPTESFYDRAESQSRDSEEEEEDYRYLAEGDDYSYIDAAEEDYSYIEKEMSLEEAIELARSARVFRPASCAMTWNCPCARCKQQRAQLLVNHVTAELLKLGCGRKPTEPEPDIEAQAKREQHEKPAERKVLRYKQLPRKEASVKQRLTHEAELSAKTMGGSHGRNLAIEKTARDQAGRVMQMPTPPPAKGRKQGHRRQYSLQETQVIQLLANMAASHRRI
ncbi:hypothetical protein CALVIDRAFT_555123 [Calocera viscosa TUFC12733]|uniref:Uncharacterized protein n=1 Tax=Calocera viscosa (strain TUFC12733) TaxID=1330018 RepID=A0A167M5V3_CALVF|nr:hypothetical protein CALVIDRAFT_555123 [Calocera viscosa TUFC12733]